jgi:hypothetical protein
MSKECTCPGCRAFRGEISASEYAWYIKGCIETGNNILREYYAQKEGTSKSPFPWTTIAQINLDDDHVMLEEVIKKLENPDPALLNPEDYCLRIESKKEK